jgi:glycosyltransferase involved in cell wall biosynthesis
VGKQSYQKGQDLLLDAWKEVNNKHPDWNLAIYGKFEPTLKLEEKTKDLNIEKSVSFYKHEKDIQSKYMESSIYVMSSRFERFGMVLIEVQSFSLPIVSFDFPTGSSDIVKNYVDGFILAQGMLTI